MNRQAQRLQSHRVISGLELDVGKNHAVAAKAAFEAEAVGTFAGF